MTGPLGSCCRTLAQSVGIFCVTEEYDVDLALGLLALPGANEFDCGVAEESGSVLCNFEINIVYDLETFENPEHSADTHSAVPARY